MCTGTAISFYLSHLHLLVTGAGAAQVQTPTETAEGFLHPTGERFQETLNAFSSSWDSDQLFRPGDTWSWAADLESRLNHSSFLKTSPFAVKS